MELARYNLKIVLPTLLWTGILVGILVALILFAQFRWSGTFAEETAASLAEQVIPLIAAFFAAGVLDAEMKRGAHELLRSKRRPLWQTVAFRLGAALAISLAVGWGMLAALHLGIRRVPLGTLLLVSIPPSLCLALVSLWVRIRLGNAFIGYTVALAVWLFQVLIGGTSALPGFQFNPLRNLGVHLNPLLTFSSYTDRVAAAAAGALETTPYVDWWWVSKIALLVVSLGLFASITRRVEQLVEGD